MKRSRFVSRQWSAASLANGPARPRPSRPTPPTAFLKVLTERVDFTVHHIPALGRHLLQLPNIVDGRTALLLLRHRGRGPGSRGHCAAKLNRIRVRTIDRLVGHSPLRAFGAALLLDIVALVALFVAGRVVLARSATPRASAMCSASRSSRRCSTGAPSTSCSAPSCGPPRRKAASPRSTMRQRAAS